ncbi:hypothetical protein C0J52_25771 [Blattella germanica]|nr:hypothetical protein C0J52_25771 [Blattella germanica]
MRHDKINSSVSSKREEDLQLNLDEVRISDPSSRNEGIYFLLDFSNEGVNGVIPTCGTLPRFRIKHGGIHAEFTLKLSGNCWNGLLTEEQLDPGPQFPGHIPESDLVMDNVNQYQLPCQLEHLLTNNIPHQLSVTLDDFSNEGVNGVIPTCGTLPRFRIKHGGIHAEFTLKLSGNCWNGLLTEEQLDPGPQFPGHIPESDLVMDNVNQYQLPCQLEHLLTNNIPHQLSVTLDGYKTSKSKMANGFKSTWRIRGDSSYGTACGSHQSASYTVYSIKQNPFPPIQTLNGLQHLVVVVCIVSVTKKEGGALKKSLPTEMTFDNRGKNNKGQNVKSLDLWPENK